MSSLPQSPSIQFPIDDHDFDDDALWAVIDSASAASSRSRKPLLAAAKGEPRAFSPDAGEVVQRRPPKTARLTPDNRVLVVKNSTRTPLASSSPPAPVYSVKEVSPVIECPQSPAVMNQWRTEEKENFASHSLLGRFPSVSAFKQYQNSAMAILEKSDYTMISGNPFIKKSGWRKISFFFNLSFEIRDKSIEFDENRNVQRAEFVVRAYMQGGRFSDGWGSCERREKRFMKPNHDIPSTAETRAKNRACQDLLGIGEYRPGVKL